MMLARTTNTFLLLVTVFVSVTLLTKPVRAEPESWKYEWRRTDFSKSSVDFSEILSGGPPKDGIPAIDNPRFAPVAKNTDLTDNEPVIGLTVNQVTRAYPLRILTWHEIVNDQIGGVPVSVTFCPLCNAAIVFDRRLDGQVLDFGTTGKLRRSDLVMYDRQTESWWQQFTGTAIVGEMIGKELKILPARLESFANFKARAPMADVLIPNDPDFRDYGRNPYRGYDSLSRPFLYDGDMPDNIAPLARVVTVGKRAWSLELLRKKGQIETSDGLILSWQKGQNSALDDPMISQSRDVGNVLVRRRKEGKMVDEPYGVDFAFAFHAFYPDISIIMD